jgi:hypothetical protein
MFGINRYKPTNDRGGGGGRGGSAFNNASDMEDGKAAGADRLSIVSGASGRSKTTSQLEAISKLPWSKFYKTFLSINYGFL